MNDFDKALKQIDAEIERLLRAGLLLEQSRSDEAPPAQDRGEGDAQRTWTYVSTSTEYRRAQAAAAGSLLRAHEPAPPSR